MYVMDDDLEKIVRRIRYFLEKRACDTLIIRAIGTIAAITVAKQFEVLGRFCATQYFTYPKNGAGKALFSIIDRTMRFFSPTHNLEFHLATLNAELIALKNGFQSEFEVTYPDVRPLFDPFDDRSATNVACAYLMLAAQLHVIAIQGQCADAAIEHMFPHHEYDLRAGNPYAIHGEWALANLPSFFPDVIHSE